MSNHIEADPHTPSFWTAFADTPAAPEQSRIDGGEPWAVSALAGLQYYSWRRNDGMDGRYEPLPGDRLRLVREPGNPHDGNAVRVEWRNGVMLGHLPRRMAAEVAVALDDGVPMRAYVFSTGDSEQYYRDWELRALLVGQPLAPRHGDWITGAAACLDRVIFGEPLNSGRHGNTSSSGDERRPPSARQASAAGAWERRTHLVRIHRQADAAAAFACLAPAHDPLPQGSAEEPAERLRGMTFCRWEHVPPTLMTKTGLARHGLRSQGPAFADIEYFGRSRWRWYELHAVAEARPVRAMTDEHRAACAAASVLRKAVRYDDAVVL